MTTSNILVMSEPYAEYRPLVTIVGRPNVGKSTLFNRLVRQRKSIIHDQPGVTRDVLIAPVRGENFYIADTGGLLPEELRSNDDFAPYIARLVEGIIPASDLILVIVDGKAGLTPADEYIIERIRKQNKPFLVVVNKAESSKVRQDPEWLSLGIPEENIWFISALHGRGVPELIQIIKSFLPDVKQEEKATEDLPRISIVGRPNVGKSTLLNSIIGYERALVSEIAGTTRDMIEVPVRYYGKEFILVDTAGLRRKSAVDSAIEAYSITRTVKAIEASDVVVLLMTAEEPATRQDLRIFHLIVSRWKGVVVAINKWDLVAHEPHQFQQRLINYVKGRLVPMNDVPIVTVSAKEKKRVHKVVDVALNVYKRLTFRIPTSQLNRYLLPIIQETPPPSYRGKYVKIKYVTQAGIKPPTFVFFTNYPEGIKESYKRFLEKKIREKWDFTGVPLKLEFRSKWQDKE